MPKNASPVVRTRSSNPSYLACNLPMPGSSSHIIRRANPVATMLSAVGGAN